MNERHHKVLQLVGRAVTQSAEFLNSGEWDRATPEYVQSLLRRELQRVSWELARLLEPAVRDLVDESPFMRYDLRTHTEMGVVGGGGASARHRVVVVAEVPRDVERNPPPPIRRTVAPRPSQLGQ